MEWQQQKERGAKQLFLALAFNPLDLAHLVDDWRDKIFKCLEINVFWQALEDVGECKGISRLRVLVMMTIHVWTNRAS